MRSVDSIATGLQYEFGRLTPMKTFIPRLFLSFLVLVALVPAVAAAENPSQWYREGRSLVSERWQARGETEQARNVILFVGDGMSLATVAAARILEGQQRGEPGEENLLHFERYPHTALAKTYNTDRQTPDSAGTMTAMASGVKSFAGSIAIGPQGRRGDCSAQQGNELVTLLDLAVLAGMGTGIVTTTRITHATPAALYARAADRGWETDRDLPPSASEAGCTDIARQLVEYDIGGGIDVAFGGGRRAFLTADDADPEHEGVAGHRDDTNLIEQWKQRHPEGHYVWNREGFEALPDGAAGPVLGLFEPGHMNYEHDRPEDPAGEPSLAQMTRRALDVLESRGDPWFLVVEGGRIDHAHHANNAWRALTDAIAFARAVEEADQHTGDDTLILVTADHGHALTFGGYGERGNPIAGLAVQPGEGSREQRLMRDKGGRPLTVLGYASGPGYRGGERPDFDQVDPRDPDYLQESAVGLWSATHSGEDVPVYASGPGAAVVHGVIEQNVIFHIIARAAAPMAKIAEELSGDNGVPDRVRIGNRRETKE